MVIASLYFEFLTTEGWDLDVLLVVHPKWNYFCLIKILSEERRRNLQILEGIQNSLFLRVRSFNRLIERFTQFTRQQINIDIKTIKNKPIKRGGGGGGAPPPPECRSGAPRFFLSFGHVIIEFFIGCHV